MAITYVSGASVIIFSRDSAGGKLVSAPWSALRLAFSDPSKNEASNMAFSGSWALGFAFSMTLMEPAAVLFGVVNLALLVFQYWSTSVCFPRRKCWGSF